MPRRSRSLRRSAVYVIVFLGQDTSYIAQSIDRRVLVNLVRRMKSTVQHLFKKFGYQIVRRPEFRSPAIHCAWLTHLLYLQDVYNLIENVEGDIVECGVGYGNSLFKLCYLAYYEGRGRKVYGFDSFKGFPEPSSEDRSPRNPQKGQWNVSTANGIYRLLADPRNFKQEFVRKNVILIEGFFEESLGKYDGKSVAFLHLDVDLYRSYKVTLEHFWPLVAEGGAVLLDEYKNAQVKYPGASKAIDNFFGDRAKQIQYHERADRYYVIKQ